MSQGNAGPHEVIAILNAAKAILLVDMTIARLFSTIFKNNH